MLTYFICLLIFSLFIRSESSPLKKWDKKESEYRLPDDVVPVHYTVDIKLQEDAFYTNTFSGNVSIEVTIIKPVKEIKLHYADMKIVTLQLYSTDNNSLPISYIYDAETNIVNIQSDSELSVTESYVISVSYEGILSETAMNGFYKSSYNENGTIKYLAVTDFEATNARKAFPCFDEPGFKATFDISLFFPQRLNALANTKIIQEEDVDEGLKKVMFQTTPKMSTYLLAFIVSEFTCVEGGTVDDAPTGVCSRNGTQNNAQLAASTAPKVLKVMEEYTGYKYATSNITKLTQLAIPDFAAGAMENWGLVTFREVYLLWDEQESSNINQESVVSVVSHELSHQWFGDLVTLDWWTNIFLNEGFATYFEYYVTNELYPDWEHSKHFVVEQLQRALLTDSFNTSSPLSYYVETPDKISERFDDISYNKGGSILRMVHYFLGLDNFKSGLKDYVFENQFTNTNPEILWNSFEKYAQQLPAPQTLPATMVDVMENWTYRAGYPLLTINSVDGGIIISQEQFLLTGSSDTKWYVPLTYTVSNENFISTTTRAWLVPSENLTILIPSNETQWIIFNNQGIGFYRINYDEKLWAQIFEAFSKPDFMGIDVINRAQIVDDLFNLARANKKSYPDVLHLLTFLKNEDAYYPWYSAFTGFTYIIQRTGNATLLDSVMEYIAELTQKLYNSTPFDNELPDEHIYTRKQILALTWACVLGNDDCVINSKKQFSLYRNQSLRPSRNLKSIVYCNGLRYSDNITQDFLFIWDKFIQTQVSTEQVTILNSLGCAKDVDILNEYLQESIRDGSHIRIQDAKFVYSGIYSSNGEGVDIVFDFAINNYQQILTHFGDSGMLNSIISSVADRFTKQQQVEKLRNFIDNSELDETTRTSASEALKNAEANLEVTALLEAQLKEYFGNNLY